MQLLHSTVNDTDVATCLILTLFNEDVSTEQVV
jgi:hypothetical protein